MKIRLFAMVANPNGTESVADIIELDPPYAKRGGRSIRWWKRYLLRPFHDGTAATRVIKEWVA